MPRYELMYILASSVSDDQVPATTSQIEQFVSDFGGSDISHELLGKKKLAYQIGKTRNGHYGVINFSMDGAKLATLDAKLRTQKASIIRYILVNIDEHLERLEKDRVTQSKMKPRRQPVEETATEAQTEIQAKPAKKPVPVSEEKLEEEIEKALNEDIAK